MIRRALLVAVCLLPACKCNGKKATATATATATPDAGPRPKGGVVPATEPDPDFESNRAKLLARGNPDVMKPAPVMGDAPAEASATDLIRAVSKDVMMVKEIKVDLARHRAEIPGKVAGDPKAILEFIAVSSAGRAYESLFTVDATAVQLRLALTLLGHDGTTPDDKGGVAAPAPGQTMRVLVRVGDEERPLEAILTDRASGKPPKELPFQVIGFGDADKNAALSTEQFISLVSHEPFAPLRVVGQLGNPYAGPNQGLMISSLAPAKGSAVTVILEDISP